MVPVNQGQGALALETIAALREEKVVQARPSRWTREATIPISLEQSWQVGKEYFVRGRVLRSGVIIAARVA